MTEWEKFIVKELKENDIVKLYVRSVKDTLLAMKKKGSYLILNKFNSFRKMAKFPPTLLKIMCFIFFTLKFIYKLSRHIYHRKNQLVNTQISFTLWKWKTSRITSLTIKAKWICSKILLNKEMKLIKVTLLGMLSQIK